MNKRLLAAACGLLVLAATTIGMIDRRSPAMPDGPAARIVRRLLPVKPALAWDADSKRVEPVAGAEQSVFVFHVTNVSRRPAFLTRVKTSCGCTVAKLPPLPLELAPNASFAVPVTLKHRGKQGLITKLVVVETSDGIHRLTVQAQLPVAPPAGQEADSRQQNQQVALTDARAVFRGDCASCHATPAKGQSGESLYRAVCGICHDSEQRAAAVPELRTLASSKDAGYWRYWITHGRAGSMMPGFAQSEGGPLDGEQIQSLVNYLAGDFAPSTLPRP
jgi:mono/diheme cytochrome c family protein